MASEIDNSKSRRKNYLCKSTTIDRSTGLWLDGIAKVEIDNKELILKDNQSSYIPVGAKHRLSNIGKNPLILIEVQCGSYLGEDDIQRFEDNYGRTNQN